MLLKKVLFLLLFVFSVSLSAQTARLQVIHNAADVTAGTVDVYLNGSLLLEDFSFRDATPFIDAPSGTQINIGIAPPNTSINDTLKNFAVTLQPGGSYVAIANGVIDPSGYAANPDGRNTAFTLFIKEMARETGIGTGVDFFVVHGSTDAPAVDVIARRVGTLVSNAAYGDITDYLTVPAASYILDITPTGVPSTIVASFEADLSGLGGGSAVVFASGFLNPAVNQNGEAFGLFAALANGTVVELPSVSLARLQVIHNAADLAASIVDVYVNGDLFLEDFAFRTATPFVDVPAGVELNIGIAPPNSTVNDTLRNFAVTLENGNTYVVLANGVVDPASYAPNPDGRSTAFTLFAKDDVRESGLNAGNVDFFVVHGSTDAPTVDIIARGVAKLVDDAAYGDITGYIEVPAAAYTLDITPGNDNNVIVASYLADLSGLGGSSLVVFASGFFNPAANQNGPAFGVFAALADGQVVGLSNVTSIEKDETAGTISDFSLGQNYPNPFNPSTVISFALPQQEFVTLKVFNIIGQEVATLVNDNLQAGRYDLTFDARALTSGVYLYQLQAGNFAQTKKMILTK